MTGSVCSMERMWKYLPKSLTVAVDFVEVAVMEVSLRKHGADPV